MNSKIPITIITGFLGSGKTTLLNHILQENHGLRIAVVENEFWKTGIDGALIHTTSTEEIIEVSNGCLCCMVRKDWMEAIERLLETGKHIDAIIIEASGVSAPMPIAQSFLMNDMNGRVKLDSIICMIDWINYEGLFAQNAQIALEQLEFADFIIVNKCDLIDDVKRQFLVSAIRQVNAIAPVIYTEFWHVDYNLLLDSNRFILRDTETNTTPLHQSSPLDTFEYTARGKFFLGPLNQFFEDLDTDCYRVKGFVQFVEKWDEWYLLQKAGARMTLEKWEDTRLITGKLVFIGRNLKSNLLHKYLDACIDAPKSVLFV